MRTEREEPQLTPGTRHLMKICQKWKLTVMKPTKLLIAINEESLLPNVRKGIVGAKST